VVVVVVIVVVVVVVAAVVVVVVVVVVVANASPLSLSPPLCVTEQLVLLLRSKIKAHGDEHRLTSICRLLNENLNRVVLAKEKNPLNLMVMFDVMFNFIAFRFRGAVGAKDAEG